MTEVVRRLVALSMATALSCPLAAAQAPAAEQAEATADAPYSEAPRGQTLTALLAIAEDRYPGLDAGDAAVDAANARLREARTSPFMQFNLEVGGAMVPASQGTPIYTPSGQLGDLGNWGPAASVMVSGAIPLFTFGKIRETWAAARAGVDAAEHGRDRTRSQLRLDVRRAFYGLSFSLDVLQMISEGEGKLASALERFDEILEEGEADLDPMDRYRLAAALAEIRARRSQATFAEASARAALETMTGIADLVITDCPLERVRIELGTADELAADVSTRPEIAMLSAARDARAAELGIHRARYYPDLVLALSAGYSVAPGVTDVANPYIQDRANNRVLGFGLAARWSLDFGGNRQRVLRARAQVAEIEAQLEEASMGASIEVRVARERVADAQRRIDAWSEGERQTRQWFVSAAQAQQVGTMEPRALVDALKAYFMARLSRLEATLDHNVAVAQLERLLGRPLAEADAWEPRCE